MWGYTAGNNRRYDTVRKAIATTTIRLDGDAILMAGQASQSVRRNCEKQSNDTPQSAHSMSVVTVWSPISCGHSSMRVCACRSALNLGASGVGLVDVLRVDAGGLLDGHLLGFVPAADDEFAVVGFDVDVVGEPALGVGVFGVVEFPGRRGGVGDAAGGPELAERVVDGDGVALEEVRVPVVVGLDFPEGETPSSPSTRGCRNRSWPARG